MQYARAVVNFFLIVGLVSLQACKKNEGQRQEENGNGVRLKHLTAASQVVTALGAYMQRYDVQGDGSFTNEGQYPRPPHIYYFTVNFRWDIDGNVYAWRSINCQAGMGKDTKEEILEMDPDLEEVADGRLGKAPYENVFAVRYRYNEKGNWWYQLHLRLAHVNQDNQEITLSGSFGPTSNEEHAAIAPEPPDATEAISAMLTLVEPIN